MAGSPPAAPGSFLPGIDFDLEPLEPFYDDVFAGMDEHPAGPWGAHQHHMLQGDPLCAETHFPAIDCNLLDDQAAAAHAPVVHGEQPAALAGVQAAAGSAHSSVHASCQHAPGAHPDEPHWSIEQQQQEQEQQGEAGAFVVEQRVAATAAPAAADADQATAESEASQQPSSSTEAASAAAFPAVMPPAADPPSQASSSSGEAAGSAAESAAAPDADASRAAETAAADSPEPSSGSLPDIDDVPEVQEEDVAEEQQQQEAPGRVAAETAQEQLQQQQQHCDADDDASLQQEGPQAAVLQSAGGGSAQQPADSHSCPAASTGAACPADTLDSDSQEQQEAVELVSAEAAAMGDCSPAAFLGHEVQQSLPTDDFASPCSSWHSCVTAASKVSSMNSSRGFLLQPPAAAAAGSAGVAAVSAAAALAAASDTEKGASQGPKHHHQQQQQQQQVAPSKGGVSSPAMVSSLHLALQAQQQHSQHSDQLAASATLEDPLNAAGPATATASVSSLAAGIAELAGDTAAAAAAQGSQGAGGADSASNSSSGEEGKDGRSSQPIAVQCAHEHNQRQQQQQRREDDPWQSVSPPSFSSSPGLLISAAAARAAAAAGAAAQGEQAATGVADAHSDADAAAHAVQEGVSSEQQQEAGDTVEADDDVGHGCFYADAAGLSMSPEQNGLLYHPGLLQQQHPQHQHMAASSYMLRQSELVDLSLSTSMHPSQLQHMQQQAVQHPGWLTAHQQLPPAAAQAVERAVVALNDSYCYPGRTSPSEVLGSAAAASAPSSSAAGGARAMGAAAMGAVGGAIRRSGAGVQWNRAHTQPQQDQQARHRLPSQVSPSNAARPFGWPGATVLGDWFSSTLQQPLAAVAVGVGQRLGMAHCQHQQGQQGVGARQHSSGSRQHAQPSGASSTSGSTRAAGVVAASAGVAPAGAGADALDAAAAGETATAGSARGVQAEDSSLEDEAVLVEKTSDLPQSLQEQEDEAFRGLLFLGGRDSQGRPVVVINTDAIPAGHNSAPRDAALAYLLKRLSPVVTRVSEGLVGCTGSKAFQWQASRHGRGREE